MIKPEENQTDPDFKPKTPYIKLYSNKQGGSLGISPKYVRENAFGFNAEKMPQDLVLTQCDNGNAAGIANSSREYGTTFYNLGELTVSKYGDQIAISLPNLDRISGIGAVHLSLEQTKELIKELNSNL